MKLHELSPAPGSKRKATRVGRGMSSGHGKTSGRGQKGQLSRSGRGQLPGFEGGQMPLHRRVPKRGFVNIFSKQYAIVNVASLNRFKDGDTINADALLEAGLIKDVKDGVKILGKGNLDKKLTVKADKFSGSAKEKIESAGGKTEVN